MVALQSKVETPVKAQPHRFRVSVPAADEAVVEWMNLQDNPSLSVRMLIRESIERLGYVDVVNRPVAQLPKRGRPAGSAEDERTSEETTALPVPDLGLQPAAASPAEQRPRAETPTPAPEPHSVSAVPVPTSSEPEQSSSELHDVNDIFSMTR